MALDAVVFPQDFFGCTMKEFYSLGGGAWSYGFGGVEDKGVVLECEMGGGCGGGGERQDPGRGMFDGVHGNWDSSCSSLVQNLEEWDVNSSPPSETGAKDEGFAAGQEEAAVGGRRKRRRTRSFKNKEEVENQRMSHIAVERNRRKQMNEYLAVLRSLMPPSYVQRGDQASIVGGAINYVKELEQLLQSLEAQKRLKQRSDSTAPFADFFTFPQYSSYSSRSANCIATSTAAATNTNSTEVIPENQPAMADIEVTMVESHANLKVLSRRQPGQLLKLVVGLQSLQLTTLHLNVTTLDRMVLYSFSLKVEDNCQFTSVDEIASAVYQMVGKIQEESGLN